MTASAASAEAPQQPPRFLRTLQESWAAPVFDWFNKPFRNFFVSPFEFTTIITDPYGYRRERPVKGASVFHQAIDLRANYEKVFSSYPGVIVASSLQRTILPKQLRDLESFTNLSWVEERLKERRIPMNSAGPFDRGYGKYVIVGIFPDHDFSKPGTFKPGEVDWGGFILYAHLSEVTQEVWSRVSVDDQIGVSGRTGVVSGPCLHVAIHLDPRYVPPGLREKCTVQSGNFADTCPVNPSRFVPREGLKRPALDAVR